MPKPSMSEARCAESVKMAIDPAIYPPISCAVMKKTETIETVMSLFIDFLLFSFCFSCARTKLIGVLTGMGVPCMSSCLLLPLGNMLLCVMNGYSCEFARGVLEIGRAHV